MKTNPRQQLLLIGAAAAIVFLAGDRMILSPLLRVWRERSERIGQLTKSIQHGRALADREPSIRARWQSMQTSALPEDRPKAEDTVLRALDRWQQESRVGFTQLKPQWKASDDHLTFECRADAVGNIEALTKFLFHIESDPLPIKIEELEITGRDANGEQLALTLRVSGLVLSEQDEP